MNLEEVLKDEEIIKISNKAAQTFTDSLSKDEIKNCIMSATWSAINNFKQEKNTKFTTYLYKGVVYECIKQKKTNNRKSSTPHYNISSANHISCKLGFDFSADLVDEINICEDPSLIYEKYYYNYTLNDMAKKRGISKEAVRFKLKKNLNFLKSRLS